MLQSGRMFVSHLFQKFLLASTATLRCSYSQTTSILPSISYAELVKNGKFNSDEMQAKVLVRLDALHNEMINNQPPKQKSFFNFVSPAKSIKGVYLYGSVGCGKTMLMDLFYASIDSELKKERIHFHEFMLKVHNKIHDVRKTAPKAVSRTKASPFDPIPPVANWISSQVTLLCFDEFQVTDIADAMILKRLFEELYKNNIIVVATSNRHPDDLYKNGLQRVNFLPFIDLIKQHCDILCLDSSRDYRRSAVIGTSEFYLVKQDGLNVSELMDLHFKRLIHWENSKVAPTTLTVFGRPIVVPKSCGRIADFNFDDLCEAPLSAADYVSIAVHFHTVIIRDVPHLNWSRRSALRRFITLVDTLYDNSVRLLVSAVDQPDGIFRFEESSESHHEDNRMLMDDLGLKASCENTKKVSLFTGEEELFATERTVSRLLEMQTPAYWKQASHDRKTQDYHLYCDDNAQ